MMEATHTSGSVHRGKSYVSLYFIPLPSALKLFSLCFTKIYALSLDRRHLRVANKLRSSDASPYIFIIRQGVAYIVALFKYIIK